VLTCLILLTDFIKSLVDKTQSQQSSLKQQNLIISPSQSNTPETPPVFLVHLETTAPKGTLLWTCLKIWETQTETKYTVKFTLIREHKTSSKLIEGAKPCNRNRYRVTFTAVDRFLALACDNLIFIDLCIYCTCFIGSSRNVDGGRYQHHPNSLKTFALLSN